MNHIKISREQWLALLAGLFFVFGFGVVVGNTGFRVDSGALGNIYGLAPNQWGVLLSGFFGSAAGGAIAIWVLVSTLKHQEKTHHDQLQQAERLHTEQLSNQTSEATRQRSTTAAAALLSGLWLVNRASEASADEMRQQIDAMILAAHSLRLERQHDDLAKALMAMIGELEETPEVVTANEVARKKLLQITGKISGAVVVWFQAGDSLERDAALLSIRTSEKEIKSLVASKG